MGDRAFTESAVLALRNDAQALRASGYTFAEMGRMLGVSRSAALGQVVVRPLRTT